jgi:hypothetical protein
LGKSTSRLRFELSTKSGHDFQNLFGHLLGELMEGTAVTKKMGRLDRIGIDAITISAENDTIETAIQCKGFELPEYDADQHRQCREEIAKYTAKGPHAGRYWLAINRPIKDRQMRGELLGDLKGLVESNKADAVELLDREPMLAKLRNLAAARLAVWAEAKRAELFEYYGARLRFVDYIRQVPFNGGPPKVDPAGYVLDRIEGFFRALPEHQTGKNRPAPKLLVTSGFGFGKTSALHAIAQAWVQRGNHLIYAPAALLEDTAFVSASGLADALLALIVPDDAEISDLGMHVFRDALKDKLTASKDWLVLLDALDENGAAFRPNNLATLWGSLRDLGIPAVLSARDELVETRDREFFPDPKLKIAPVFDRIRLDDWTDDLILEFLNRFAAARGNPPAGFQEFRNVVTSGRYAEVYGDIPKRPLFLGMLAEDAWSGHQPARELHRLYGKYFRQKFLLDRHSVAAGGASRRPSAIVDDLGLDEAAERLIQVMQEVAKQLHLAQHNMVAEPELRVAAAAHGVAFSQIEDIAMHSLLQPAGRDSVSRVRLMRFAHRSYQEWFTARYFAEHGSADTILPGAIGRFFDAMRADLVAGAPLP